MESTIHPKKTSCIITQKTPDNFPQFVPPTRRYLTRTITFEFSKLLHSHFCLIYPFHLENITFCHKLSSRSPHIHIHIGRNNFRRRNVFKVREKNIWLDPEERRRKKTARKRNSLFSYIDLVNLDVHLFCLSSDIPGVFICFDFLVLMDKYRRCRWPLCSRLSGEIIYLLRIFSPKIFIFTTRFFGLVFCVAYWWYCKSAMLFTLSNLCDFSIFFFFF